MDLYTSYNSVNIYMYFIILVAVTKLNLKKNSRFETNYEKEKVIL